MNLHNAQFVRSVTSVADCPHDGIPQIVFAGKSNVGKSSVINKLLLRKNFARVGEAPGKTTHINYFLIDEKMYLIDLPGYGYAKVSKSERERWGKLMEAYFAAPDLIDLGVMLVDARHKPTANDVTMASYFLQTGKPFIVVANKLDKLKKSEIEPNLACIRETLALPEDTLYLALSPAVLETLAARYGAVRVSLSGALTAEELDAIGQSPSVQTFRAREASDLLTGLDADGLLPPSRRAAARAAVWDAFFRQNFELLPSTLPEALRSQSSSLLTDFAAQDYTLLGDILEFLVNRAAVFQSDALPGAWDRKAGTYTVTEASRAAVQTFLNVSPTEGQASSASEP